jgi:hypothetical protein
MESSMLLRGKVALSTGHDANRKLQVSYCKEGSILGLAETLTGHTYETTAFAATDVVVRFVSHCDVMAMVSDTRPGTGLVSSLAEQLRDLQKVRKCFTLGVPIVPKERVC